MEKKRNMKILSIGSTNVDQTYYVDHFPQRGETIRAISSRITPGGKGLNQAVAIARSGGSVSFLSAIGSDKEGEYITDVLFKENIDTHLKEIPGISTGNANIVVDSNGENKIIIVEGANGNINKKLLDDENKLIVGSDIIVIQNEIEKATNEYIIGLAGKRKKIILWNPAPKGLINKKYFKFITYFTPNENELDYYVNNPNLSMEEKCHELLESGIKNIIVTLGSRGVYYQNNMVNGIIPAEKVHAIDTVCAGDTFNGYFINAIACGKSFIDAIKIGNLAASKAVQKKGAMNSIPYSDEVYC